MNNDLQVPGDVLFSFNASSSDFGKNIFIQQNNVAMLKISEDCKSDFTISFSDQDFRPLQMKDPNICLQLVIQQ